MVMPVSGTTQGSGIHVDGLQQTAMLFQTITMNAIRKNSDEFGLQSTRAATSRWSVATPEDGKRRAARSAPADKTLAGTVPAGSLAHQNGIEISIAKNQAFHPFT